MNAKAKPAALQEQGTASAAAAAPTPELPALGAQVTVQDPLGVLFNLESGQRFEPNKPTPQRVTAHTLQRLQDGCLVLVV